jgi:hypothetical protein
VTLLMQVGQWQPPPLPMTCGALAHHLAPRSPLIPEPQRVLPQVPPHSGPTQALLGQALQQKAPPPQRLKSASLSLSRVGVCDEYMSAVGRCWVPANCSTQLFMCTSSVASAVRCQV